MPNKIKNVKHFEIPTANLFHIRLLRFFSFYLSLNPQKPISLPALASISFFCVSYFFLLLIPSINAIIPDNKIQTLSINKNILSELNSLALLIIFATNMLPDIIPKIPRISLPKYAPTIFDNCGANFQAMLRIAVFPLQQFFLFLQFRFLFLF